MNDSRQNLLAFQWSAYPDAHQNRRNLLIHLFTNPLFIAGNVVLLNGLWHASWMALFGLGAMALAMAGQGRGHRMEETPPALFRGPLDVVLRIFAEQWITWPRFVLSGGFARALRATREASSNARA